MRHFAIKICAVILAVLLALTGCASGSGQDYSSYAPSEENRLVIYSSHLEEIYAPLVKEFEERTGIWVQVEYGGTLGLLERIASESENPRCDLIFGGGLESLDSYKSRFSPYKSDLAKDLPPEYIEEDGLWTPFSIPPVVLIYNPKLIRTNPPTGWNSLLDPAWKGKIAFAEPETSGSSYTALATMLQILPGEDEQLLKTFYNNLEGNTISRSSMVVEEVLSGSCYIGITLEENALRSIKNGYDIAMVYPEEGTSAIPDGMAVISGCAHEDNARRFIDFALSRDVQFYLSQSCNLRAVKEDIPKPDGITENFPLFPYDIPWAGSQQENILLQWRSLREGVTP